MTTTETVAKYVPVSPGSQQEAPRTSIVNDEELAAMLDSSDRLRASAGRNPIAIWKAERAASRAMGAYLHSLAQHTLGVSH